MRIEVEPSNWTDCDSWWSVYTQNWPSIKNSDSVQKFDTSGLADCWEELDSWWRLYTKSSPYVHHPSLTRTLVPEQSTDSWEELDAWWHSYTETGHETAVKIAHLLSQSNLEWKQSAGPFDTDPLAKPLTEDNGPLLPSKEEGWSDWLAKLLRPSEDLVSNLFDMDVQQAPSEVIREKQLLKGDGGFRRPDILIFHEDQGISVEVKLDDENYGKTAETARLVEERYNDYDWTHVILLPESKKERLESIVIPPVESQSGESLKVEWDDPGPVVVMFWRDLTRAIRTLLLDGGTGDDQWAASAYLFCAAVEQQIMNFPSQPIVDGMADPTSVVDTIQPIAVAGVLNKQLTYFEERQKS